VMMVRRFFAMLFGVRISTPKINFYILEYNYHIQLSHSIITFNYHISIKIDL